MEILSSKKSKSERGLTPEAIKELIDDLRYIVTMSEMDHGKCACVYVCNCVLMLTMLTFSDWIEKAKGQVNAEKNRLTDVVPVSGRLFAIFRTYEQDHQTALEVWDWQEKKESGKEKAEL